MALGDYNNNNSEQQMFRPTVYGYSLYSNNSNTAKSRIAFSMWQKTIKISIERMIKEGSNGHMSEYDSKNPSVVYLTAPKALMLGELLAKYIKDPETFSGYGVSSARAFISINRVDGEDILQIDSVSGEDIREGEKYVINTKHPVVSGWRNGNRVYDNDLFNALDFVQIISQLKDYAKAMNNTIAFSVIDNNSWNTSWYRDALRKIAGASNINLGNGSKKSSSNSGSGDSHSQFGSESGSLDDFM